MTPTGSDVSVTDQLGAIETSVLDQLLEMRQEELRIEEYRQRADSMKDAVDPLVFQRVVTDYKTRLASLEAKATPLKVRARKEYAKLRVLLDRITAEQKTAQVSKAELDFRHAVGELDDASLAERLQEPVGIIARCDEELTAVGALRTRFIDAFGAEIELESPGPATPEPAAPVPPVPASPAKATSSAVEPAADHTPPASAPTPLATPIPPMPPAEPDATSFVMVDELYVEATIIGVSTTQPLPAPEGSKPLDPAATMLHSPAAVMPAGDDDHTFLLPAAALLINPDDPSPQEYRLAAVNNIGRSDDNHLQLARPGVSRRHAVIVAAGGGFMIQDLGSQNGVFVNGERISEHALKDGEQVLIGDRTMLYRTPWPPKGAKSDSRTRATKA